MGTGNYLRLCLASLQNKSADEYLVELLDASVDVCGIMDNPTHEGIKRCYEEILAYSICKCLDSGGNEQEISNILSRPFPLVEYQKQLSNYLQTLSLVSRPPENALVSTNTTSAPLPLDSSPFSSSASLEAGPCMSTAPLPLELPPIESPPISSHASSAPPLPLESSPLAAAPVSDISNSAPLPLNSCPPEITPFTSSASLPTESYEPTTLTSGISDPLPLEPHIPESGPFSGDVHRAPSSPLVPFRCETSTTHSAPLNSLQELSWCCPFCTFQNQTTHTFRCAACDEYRTLERGELASTQTIYFILSGTHSQYSLGAISACTNMSFQALYECLRVIDGNEIPFGCTEKILDQILTSGAAYTSRRHQDLEDVILSRHDLMQDLHQVHSLPSFLTVLPISHSHETVPWHDQYRASKPLHWFEER
jgi:hypothetical protein